MHITHSASLFQIDNEFKQNETFNIFLPTQDSLLCKMKNAAPLLYKRTEIGVYCPILYGLKVLCFFRLNIFQFLPQQFIQQCYQFSVLLNEGNYK